MTEFEEFMKRVILELGNYNILLGQLIAAVFSVVLVIILYLVLNKVFLHPLVIKQRISNSKEKKIVLRRWILMFTISGITLILWILGVNVPIMELAGHNISLLTLLVIIILLTFSSLIDWIFTYVWKTEENGGLPTYERRSRSKYSPGANIQFIVFTIAIILALRGFGLDFNIFPSKQDGESIDFYFSNLFTVLLILLVARFIIWVLTHLILSRYYKMKGIEQSSQYAINQILTYVIFVVAIIVALENMGIKMTLIWGGAAALLVGVGLGLQQTFNDLISGIILLFERTVEVGAVIEIEGEVGIVRKIGIRTSIIESRDNIAIIVPNSKLIVDSVINWNHNDTKARFIVPVGVAYGSDTELVNKLIVEVANKHPDVLPHPKPFVRFKDFGNSSLDMELHFWSHKLMPIENVKSDLRFAIDKAFREHKVSIPFPQRDLWIRNMPPIQTNQKDENSESQ